MRGDGSVVACLGDATKLVPCDPSGVIDLCIHDFATGEAGRVSVTRSGGWGAEFLASASRPPSLAPR